MRSPWLASLLACLAAADISVFDKLSGTSYLGTSADGVDQFQAIPFGEDTSGANRFAPPKPYFPPTGSIINATKPGAACPQAVAGIIPPMSNVDYQSEDCLNLRIARPAGSSPSEKPLPVMVYIFGGGSALGTAYDGFFNPVGLVQQSVQNGEPVVYVAMNYRLGIFGFPASETLKSQKAENLGLRDQYLALQWVKANIGAFGGDPNRITIFGQSFGGISVGLQLVAWGAEREPPFHKAIMTSGGISKDRNDTFVKNRTAVVADQLGCRPEMGPVDGQVLNCLREVPLADLLKSNIDVMTKDKPPFGFAAFSAVVDGDIIPEQPLELLLKGRFQKNIPLIVTWTSDDGSLSADSKTSNDSEVVGNFASGIEDFSDDVAEKILSLYPVSDFEDQARAYPGVSPQYFRASRIIRDLDPVCPLLTLVEQFNKYGTKDLYVGELNETRLLPYWQAWGEPWDVSHLSDIPYFFNEALPSPGDNSPGAMALSANYSGSFVSFANSGNPVNPGKKTFQAWPQADSHGSIGSAALVIGGPHGTGPATVGLGGESSSDPPVILEGVEQEVLQELDEPDRRELKKRDLRTRGPSPRSAAFENEKLAERCKYLSTLRFN